MKKNNDFEIKSKFDDKSSKYDLSRFSYDKHEDGFLIFVDKNNIELFDEYINSDPYSVKKNLQSDFHRRRILNTIELLSLSIGNNKNKIKVLDLGCGEGHITEEIRLNFDNIELSALDMSLSAIKYAHANYGKIDFIVADAYSTPYLPGYFDVVICNNIWEHVPDPLRLLGEISKILKPSGNVIVSTPSRYRISNIIRSIKKQNIAFMSGLHVTEYTVGQVCEQLKFGGYDIVKSYGNYTDNELKLMDSSFLLRVVFYFVKKFLKDRSLEYSLCETVFYLARKNG